jgi:transcriptional regulator with XRE-family HTH domain
LALEFGQMKNPTQKIHNKDLELLQKTAKRIKNLREEKKITQETFYNDTNIHIARLESGKVNMSLCTIHSICKYLNITLSTFFEDL